MSFKICSVDNCHSRTKSRGLCASHYKFEHRNGTYDAPDRPACKMEGCTRAHRYQGLCQKHYQIAKRAEQRAKNQECIVQPCAGTNYREGHCNTHYLERFPKTVTRIPDCRRPNCTKPQFKYLGCEIHWRNYQPKAVRMIKTADSCIEDECPNKRFSMDRCQKHYNEWKNQARQADDFWEFVKAELNLESAK